MALGDDISTGTSGGLGAIGIGGSLFSSLSASGDATQAYAAQKQIANLEMQADAQRYQAMEISGRRQQLQNVRNAQQARSNALASAVGSGAQFSSSAETGQGQASAQAAYGNLGVSQNLQIGQNLFAINSQIDEQKILQATAQSNQASAQGLGSIFGGLSQGAGSIGKLASLLPALAI